ncbi:MAG: hypothetical protein JSS32_09840 [Verrucomicrobia bacterium]|nr:hypothetical protein [Verrucomicrobiota bacterium]
MSVAHKEEVESKSKNSVDDVIHRAVKKIGGRKENELCKYLPMKSGGYMHHFTLKKMKYKQPQELASIIERFVINSDKPVIVSPKQRAARGSRKRRDHMNFTRNQLERMLNIARLAGDKEIITILSPKKSLATCKRELIQAIRQNRVEQELWNSYAEAIQTQQNILANSELLQH